MPEGDQVAGRLNALMESGDFDLGGPPATGIRPTTGRSPRRAAAGPSTAWPGPTAPSCIPRSTPRASTSSSTRARTPTLEGYSGFDGTTLVDLLRERGVEQLTIAGLATDYCVRATALDALAEGFAVTLDAQASRGIDASMGDVERALAEVRAAGGVVH